MKGFTYLAAPYHNDNQMVMESRLTKVTAVAAHLIKSGEVVFSPLTHNAPIRDIIGGGWEDRWREVDFTFLEKATKLHVLTLVGWDTSIGVTAEIKFAKSVGIPIVYRTLPNDL